MKAAMIIPSTPIILPKGSKNSTKYFSNEVSPQFIFASIQIIAPAGAATMIALPRTNMVLSNIERIITLPIFGFR